MNTQTPSTRHSDTPRAVPMTEVGGTIDAAELRARLPDQWRVEDGGSGVYGYADQDGAVGLVNSGTLPASFSIRPNGDLWAATWKGSHELGDDPRAESDRVTGARERCVEWVIERTCQAEEQVCE